MYSPKVQKYTLTNGKVDKTFSPSQPGSDTVQAVLKNGCAATSNNPVVYANPDVPIIYPTETGSRTNLCAGGIDTFFVYAWDDTTNYTWKIPKQCSLIANYNDSIVINVPPGFISGKLTVYGNNLCGTGAPDTVTLLGRPKKPGSIAGLRRVFSNQPGLICSITNDNISHHWTVPTDAIIRSGQGTNSIVVDWGSSPGFVSVNAFNDCGVTQYREIEVSLRDGIAATGPGNAAIKIVDKSEASLFPNPATNSVTVRFNSSNQMKYTIELQNMNGSIMMRKNIIATKGLNSFNIDINRYASGMYLVNIKNAEGNIRLKFTKE